ncbi:ATP synthase protein I [Nitrosomonas cryotolerans]|uniref:ATP synthase protein I n=1 Tax=Nitrosomonas cryotolerans ATCC 49181 TaxID=1131553 RepID=A0A1N6FG63_9PROT|nr:ATP synthase subunit I [Nitrosomonas cryotolerans]SFP63067.1 ATP synthase protein I [Nitrosomonas cryotolerans]SIN94235.1 ATP synthase protein I [Nitrosomonas cryotolerans ATCC 49181]
MPWIKNRPLRIILIWQMLFVIVVAIVLGVWADLRSAVSAVLGGMVSIISSAAFALIVSNHRGYTASGTLRTALRAEAVKIIFTVILLWLVFKWYEDVNALAFVGTFAITVIVYSMALFISDDTKVTQVNK